MISTLHNCLKIYVSEIHYNATKLIFVIPKGRPWMLDVDLPVWNLRVVIWFPFLISFLAFLPRTTVLALVVIVLLLFLSSHFSANGPFSWLLPENSQTFCSCCCFCVLRLVRVRLFCMAVAYNHFHLPSPPPQPPSPPPLPIKCSDVCILVISSLAPKHDQH